MADRTTYATRTERLPVPTYRVCAEDGCPETATDRGRCRHHHLVRSRGKEKRRSRPIGYNAAWRRLSARYRREHPTCEKCGGAPAEHVDHIDGLGPAGPRGHDPTNLQALCRPCHSRKTALRDGGFGRPRQSARYSR